MRKVATIASLAVIVSVSGCTTKKTAAPPLTGPSGFALQLSMQAVPDSILQDGASQASIFIDATGPDGRPVRALPFRIEMAVVTDAGETFADFGTLSAKTVVTGEDGRARVVYTAPPRPATSVGQGTILRFYVTPIGNDYAGEQPRSVSLRLVPPGIILPPNAAPVAAFTFSPTAASALQDIVFDASTSTDEGLVCGAVCSYAWDFGDQATATGIFVTHRYQRTGTYLVRLTVTDAGGAATTVTQAVTVGQGQPPTATFTFSPTAPAASQDIFFNAGSSTAVTNRRIVAYDWDFGSGRTGSGVTVTKRYDTPGTYVVTLTVTDDAGSRATTNQSVTVAAVPGSGGGGAPTSVFTFSPTAPSVNQTVFFNGTASTTPVGTTLTSYAWDFGDGTSASGATPTHSYAAAGVYVVRLTVSNSAGQTGTATQNVTVGGALIAVLTVSPTAGTVATNFFFDGRPSTAGQGTTITSYRFTFGDGTPDVVVVSPNSATTTHQYAAQGTYIARLTVTDSANRTATTTVNISVSP